MSGNNETQLKRFNWKAALTTAAAVVGFVATTLGLWWNITESFDKQIKTAVTSSTVQITSEIKRSTYEVIELHKDDLTLRIRILEREVDAALTAGQIVPERTLIQLQTYRDQLEEIKDRWQEYR